ncbi:P-loop NTPase fold protein [Hymenobacter roseosalivarius]|nr:P-loop NTPase fold protein [Hymenobacter roseosalivarius]
MKSKQTKKISIDIVSPEEQFNDHLNNSERVILSGPFGIGKSYFLKKYFKDNSDKYITINLKPINYAVSTNEDIFQLIKYDIIYELLLHDKEYNIFDITPIPENMMREYFLTSQFEGILDRFLMSINKIDKSALELAKHLYGLFNEYESFKKRHLEALNEFKTLEVFSKNFANKTGAIYENDFISELINKSISKLKALNKKVILIIDDLDRIDPEHIFRLINVFGAHLDVRENENKFLFNTTVLVCDIKNIRGIFRHKYGSSVDFNGYIDKFYSDEIFYYDNTSAIITWLEHNEKITSFHNKLKIPTYSFLFNILSRLSKNNLLNLRSLIKIKLDTDEIGQFLINKNTNDELYGLLFLDIFFVLRGIFQDTNSLVEKLNELDNLDAPVYGDAKKLPKPYLGIGEQNRSKLKLLENFILPVLAKTQDYKRLDEVNFYEYKGVKIEYLVIDHREFITNIKTINGKDPHTFTGKLPLWSLTAEATYKLSVLVGVE